MIGEKNTILQCCYINMITQPSRFIYHYTASEADYDLGTIGTCLGPPLAGGPHLAKKKDPHDKCKEKGRENDKNGALYDTGHFLKLIDNSGSRKGPQKINFVWSPLPPFRRGPPNHSICA